MSDLIPNPRLAGVLCTVRALGSVTVEALAKRFGQTLRPNASAKRVGVTLQAVRRDVKLLAEARLLARSHGGVRLPASTNENLAYRARQALNDEARRRVAQAVAARVPEGCSLILKVGTPTQAVARAAGPPQAARDHPQAEFGRHLRRQPGLRADRGGWPGAPPAEPGGQAAHRRTATAGDNRPTGAQPAPPGESP